MNRATAAFARLRTLPRRARRAIVLETFVAYPLVVLGYYALVVTGRVRNAIWAPLAILLMVGFVAGILVVTAFAGHRASPGTPDLDERQRDLAIRAQALSYGVVTTVLAVIAGLWAVYVIAVGPMSVGPELLLPVAIGVGVYLPILPAAILAWIEPDAPPEDEEVGAEPSRPSPLR